MASTLDNALQKAVTNVPECVAAGYVDLSTGMLLAIKTVDSHPSEILELTFVCRKSANLGMVLTKARSSLPDIEATM